MEIWAEGYIAQGNESGAIFLGSYDTDDIDVAIRLHLLNSKFDADYFNKHDDGHWYYWGCRVFDNEAEARKTFG